jgi:cobalt-zinc-cadmium efflux system protein
MVNGIALLIASVAIVVEAGRRMGTPGDVRGGGVLLVATLGIVVNLASAWVLGRAQGQSLNMRGALMHQVTDAIGLAGTCVAAIAVLLWDANWADPLMSIAIAVLVFWSGFRLLRDTVHVLLEGTPAGMDRSAVEATLLHADGVDAVHHLHLWSLASDVPALSAHVVLSGDVTLHEAQQRGEELKHLLAVEHGIAHATLELECHECEDGTHRL